MKAADPSTDPFQKELDACIANGSPAQKLRGKRAFVTGCTSGIGLAVTIDLLREGLNVTGVGRRATRLAALHDFSQKQGFLGKFDSICADCTKPEFFAALKTQTAALESEILICNAGLARGLDPVASSATSDWHEMISTNVTAVFELVRLFLPEMIRAQRGTIIGLGSIAGHVPYENGSVYCATKHAVRAFFGALRQETCGQNIRVSLVSPGMVQTGFSEVRFKGDTKRAQAVYAGVDALSAQDISQIMLQILKAPPHVNIDDIVVMPVQQGSVFKVARK